MDESGDKNRAKSEKKLNKKYIDKICELAKDKVTREMSSKHITSIINSNLEKNASSEFRQNCYEEGKDCSEE